MTGSYYFGLNIETMRSEKTAHSVIKEFVFTGEALIYILWCYVLSTILMQCFKKIDVFENNNSMSNRYQFHVSGWGMNRNW